MLTTISENPVVPIKFGAEQKGMQSGDEVTRVDGARNAWLAARDCAVHWAKELEHLGVHKSICNRLVEPFAWITVVMTATEWANFFRLRCHPDAEIHFQKIAGMIREALEASEPRPVSCGEYHLPFIQEDEYGNDVDVLARVSTARCARVSYLTHDGTRDIAKDTELFGKLCQGSGFGHWSPHEHVAEALATEERSGPFVGWRQFRKQFALENLPG